ncbi:MAG: hypothetical protein A2283_05270 [Lentisphaerae bacterium RIFOXYA12_FULL_48_11]|nr:MAG: hypothetical protein A2283_05270 [Lentisphaerae bacterium RIFOXYA12_FULL_48_11]
MNEITKAIETRNRIFEQKLTAIRDFMFNSEVVPMYTNFQRMFPKKVSDFSVDKTSVYDLGCTADTTMQFIEQTVAKSVTLVDINTSDNVQNKCWENWEWQA